MVLPPRFPLQKSTGVVRGDNLLVGDNRESRGLEWSYHPVSRSKVKESSDAGMSVRAVLTVSREAWSGLTTQLQVRKGLHELHRL